MIIELVKPLLINNVLIGFGILDSGGSQQLIDGLQILFSDNPEANISLPDLLHKLPDLLIDRILKHQPTLEPHLVVVLAYGVDQHRLGLLYGLFEYFFVSVIVKFP